MMQCKYKTHERYNIKNSRMYEWARKEFKAYASEHMKQKSKGKNNSQYGTMWICHIELKENKKIQKDEIIPIGWIRGRNKWKPKKIYKSNYKQQYKEKCCLVCGKKFKSKSLHCSNICGARSPIRRRKIAIANIGDKNPSRRYKWKWINNGTINKKLKINKNSVLPNGFTYGMIVK